MSDIIYLIHQNLGRATNGATTGVHRFFSNFLLNPVALVITVLLVFFYVLTISASSSASSASEYMDSAISNIQSGFGAGMSGISSGIGAIPTGQPTPAPFSNGIPLVNTPARAPSAPPASSGPSSMISVIMFIVMCLVAIAFLVWTYRHHIFARAWDTVAETIEETAEEAKDIARKPEVFNISDNTHVYSDAKAVCAAYDARLATYQEVEKAYTDGAEWCNYGWSDGQMALFPTQQSTYDKLQTIEGHEHDCGRPGVNGGYMANPAMKFGVNCFGEKPDMTPIEQSIMETDPIYPKTAKDLAMEKRVQYWKSRLSEILVSPFNHASWNKW